MGSIATARKENRLTQPITNLGQRGRENKPLQKILRGKEGEKGNALVARKRTQSPGRTYYYKDGGGKEISYNLAREKGKGKKQLSFGGSERKRGRTYRFSIIYLSGMREGRRKKGRNYGRDY